MISDTMQNTAVLESLRRTTLNASILSCLVAPNAGAAPIHDTSPSPSLLSTPTAPLNRGIDSLIRAVQDVDSIAKPSVPMTRFTEYAAETASPSANTLEELRTAGKQLVQQSDTEDSTPLYFDERLVSPTQRSVRIRAKLKLVGPAKPRIWFGTDIAD